MKNIPHILLFYMLLNNNNKIYQTCSKTISNTIKLTGENTEHTMVKFALSPNSQGKFSTIITTKTMYRNNDKMLKLYFYKSETTWSKVKKALTCQDKAKFATFEKSIDFRPFKPQPKENKFHYKFDLMTGLITNTKNPKPDYWYITLADCSLELYYHESETESPSIHYTSDILNEYEKDKYSHVSYDQLYMKNMHRLSLCVSFIILIILIVRCVRINAIRHELHIGCIIVIVMTILQILSTSCQYIHLLRYESNGIGFYTLDALSAYFESVVDSIMSLVLLAISSGWTLPNDIIISTSSTTTHNKSNILQNGLRSTQMILSNNNTFTTVFIIIIFSTHFILAQWGRIYNDDFDSYHDLEHLPGKILFMFRILLGFIFVFNVASLRNRGIHMTPALSRFFYYFCLLGFAWFVTVPLCAIIFVSQVLKSYQRHYVVECLSCFIQLLSLYGMTWLFFFGWDLKSSSDNDDYDSSGSRESNRSSAFHRVSKVGTGRDIIGSVGLDGNGNNSSSGYGQSMIKFGKTKIRLD